MNLDSVIPHKKLPFDAKGKHWKQVFLGNATDFMKPVIGFGSATKVWQTFETDPVNATLLASVGIISYCLISMVKTDFAKKLLEETMMSEMDACSYSKKYFKDELWNEPIDKGNRDSISSACLYNEFVIKHNSVKQFLKFDTLVKLGVKAVIRFNKFQDSLFMRFKSAARETGIWDKYNAMLDPIREHIPSEKSVFSILDEVKNIAPSIDGFIKDPIKGVREDAYKFNSELIDSAKNQFTVNNSYFSFAVLHAEVIQAINDNDGDLIKSLSGKNGIGKFINQYKYTGNPALKELSSMAESLLVVMDNYVPGDTYFFPLAAEHDYSSDIKTNAQTTFEAIQSYMRDNENIVVEQPKRFSEELLNQMGSTMVKTLQQNFIAEEVSKADGLTPEKMNRVIFPKVEEGKNKFLSKIQKAFSMDITVEPSPT